MSGYMEEPVRLLIAVSGALYNIDFVDKRSLTSYVGALGKRGKKQQTTIAILGTDGTLLYHFLLPYPHDLRPLSERNNLERPSL
jgi:hypothetical protein